MDFSHKNQNICDIYNINNKQNLTILDRINSIRLIKKIEFKDDYYWNEVFFNNQGRIAIICIRNEYIKIINTENNQIIDTLKADGNEYWNFIS